MEKLRITEKDGKGYFYLPEFGIMLPEEVISCGNVFYKKLSSFLIKKEERKRDVLQKEIKREIANVSRLLLEIAEACNLRCRYCVYSGKFVDSRKHSTRLMSWEIAKRSIDFFFDWIVRNEKYRYNPYILSIGFYGGEPLLNFEVIKNSVFYSKSLVKSGIKELKGATLNFGITTNGLLLNDEIMEFLINNDFFLTISLDGPPEIHNKNKGIGVFEKVMEKIEKICKRYPDYYKKNVSYSIVYAKDTDLKKVKDFFSQDIFENSAKLNFGDVVYEYSYLNFPEQGLNEKQVIEEIKEKKRKKEKLTKIEKEIVRNYFPFELNTLILREEGDYGAICTLGSKKLFVTLDGDFYGCERTGRSFKIGSLKKGFDFEFIKRVEIEWREKTSKKCKRCPAQAFCSACVATVGFKGRIILKKFCRDLIKDFKRKVSEYIEFQKIQ